MFTRGNGRHVNFSTYLFRRVGLTRSVIEWCNDSRTVLCRRASAAVAVEFVGDRQLSRRRR